jgi:uncharacterized membrane protein YidH (DUF202 family)
MMAETLLASVTQFATMAGILAGFSFTGVLQLVSLSSARKIVGATLSIFIAATLSFISSMFGFFFLFFEITGYFRNSTALLPKPLTNLWVILVFICLVGILLLLAGVAVAGWIRSKGVGIFSTFLALLGIISMFWIISFLINVKP